MLLPYFKKIRSLYDEKNHIIIQCCLSEITRQIRACFYFDKRRRYPIFKGQYLFMQSRLIPVFFLRAAFLLLFFHGFLFDAIAQIPVTGSWEGMYAREVRKGKWENILRWELQLQQINDSVFAGTLKEYFPDDRLKAERNRVYDRLSNAGAQQVTMTYNRTLGVISFTGSVPYKKDPTQRINGLYYAAVQSPDPSGQRTLQFNFQSSDESLTDPTRIMLRSAGTYIADNKPATIPPAGTAAVQEPVNISAAGRIAADVIYLEVDEMLPFFGKYAVVRKGESTALINDKGEVIVPFNKYRFLTNFGYANKTIYREEVGKSVALDAAAIVDKLIFFETMDREQKGYIDMKGEIMMLNQGYVDIDDFGYLVPPSTSTAPGVGFVHYKGKDIKTANSASSLQGGSTSRITFGERTWFNGLSRRGMTTAGQHTATLHDNEFLYGYIDRFGNYAIKPYYHAADDFYEGLAWVARKNEFGELRWGAINTAGELVIPLQYTHQPIPYSSGRALIKPVNTKDMKYACIDRKGELIFTLPYMRNDTVEVNPVGMTKEYKYLSVVDNAGYFLTERKTDYMEGYRWVALNIRPGKKDRAYLLDTNGTFHPVEQRIFDQLQSAGHVSVSTNLVIHTAIKNGEYVYRTSRNYSRRYGYADVKGNVILPPVFSSLEPFEKESALQRAELEDLPNGGKRTGYINRAGEFKVLLKEKSGF